MKLQTLRRQIDAVDRRLVRLLKQRMALSAQVARMKERLGLPIYAAKREHEVLRNVLRESGGVVREKFLRAIYREIKAASRDHQRRLNNRTPR